MSRVVQSDLYNVEALPNMVVIKFLSSIFLHKFRVCKKEKRNLDGGSFIGTPYLPPLLGSKIDKPSKTLIKISNAMKYIELRIQSIEAPRTNDRII